MTIEQLYKAKEILKDGCRDYFNEIKNFYYNVLTHDNVIFMNERAYNTYLLFKDLFYSFPEEIPDKYKDKKINPNINAILYDDFIMQDNKKISQDKTYLCIEDIAYGESKLLEAKKYFSENFDLSNFIAWIMFTDREPLTMRKEMKEFLKHIIYQPKNNIRFISNSLNKLNIYNNNSYSAITNVNKKMLPINTLPVELGRNDSYYDEFYIRKNIISYEFEYSIPSDVKSFIKLNQGNKLIVEPYVFLPTLNISDCYSYCKDLLNIFGEEIPNYIDTNNSSLVYKYTQMILSKKLLNEYLINNDKGTIISYDEIANMEEKIVKYLNSNLYNGSFISSKDLSYKCYSENILSAIINLASTDKVSHKIGEIDGNVSNLFSINTQTYKYFYEKNKEITDMLIEFYCRTGGENRYWAILSFCQYFDSIGKTDKYERFFHNVYQDPKQYYYDIISLRTDKNTIDDEIEEYVEKIYVNR